MRITRVLGALLSLALPRGAPAQGQPGAPARLATSEQLALVVTPAWGAVGGVLRRYERASVTAPWTAVGDSIPVVVGVNGLAWGADTLGRAREPHKREGDGRAPAGSFAVDTAFGFVAPPGPEWLRLPYRALGEGTECVDDVRSSHYNSLVERGAVPQVDWASSEHMRRVGQYRMGAVVRYNGGPIRRGRGSCIFLHIWADPRTGTAGCTAMPEHDLQTLLGWLDPARRPMVVQLPRREYARLRPRWGLP